MRSIKAAAITLAYVVSCATWFFILGWLDSLFGMRGPMIASGTIIIAVIFAISYRALASSDKGV